MNSDQLRYLIEISKNPSLSIASQKLHITPQALSTAIKKLEDELGFEVLNRAFKGISLTANGEWLVKESAAFLDKIEQRKEQHLHGKQQVHKGELNIVINHSGINDNIIGQLIGILYEQEPDLKIILKERPKEDVFGTVIEQSAEFGFVYRTKVNGAYIDELDEELSFDALFCGNQVLFAAPHTEIAKFNSVTMKKAAQYPLCAYQPYDGSIDYSHYLLSDILNLPVQYEVESAFSVYKQKIKCGIANALSVHFPTDSQPNNFVEGTKVIQLRDDIKTYFGLIRKNDTPLSSNGAFFLQELRGLIHNLKYPENE